MTRVWLRVPSARFFFLGILLSLAGIPFLGCGSDNGVGGSGGTSGFQGGVCSADTDCGGTLRCAETADCGHQCVCSVDADCSPGMTCRETVDCGLKCAAPAAGGAGGAGGNGGKGG